MIKQHYVTMSILLYWFHTIVAAAGCLGLFLWWVVSLPASTFLFDRLKEVCFKIALPIFPSTLTGFLLPAAEEHPFNKRLLSTCHPYPQNGDGTFMVMCRDSWRLKSSISVSYALRSSFHTFAAWLMANGTSEVFL